METVVQKYGGTSVGLADRMLNVASIIKNTKEKDQHVVAVLSAMSGRTKKEGTTSRLLEASNEALKNGSYYRILDLLEEHHQSVVKEAITDRTIQEQLREEINSELHQLKSFLDAIQVIGEISPRSQDVIIGTGEKLSARILAGVLNSIGIDADYINLETLVDKPFHDLNLEFCLYLQKKLAAIINNCGARVPVVTGYFGFVPNGIIKTIGRGYTDFTAALIAAGINAQELQIWKEVDGIFSADPNKVQSAKVLSSITPAEAMELTYFGSEVIHPFTMEQVSRANVPVRIKNTFNPAIAGTIIDPKANSIKIKSWGTAVTVKRNVTLVNINSNRMLMAYGFMSKVFDVFNRFEIVIDLISTSEVNISMTVDSNQNLTPAITELKNLGQVTVLKGIATISLVGEGMKQKPGIAAKMFSQLAEQGVNIEIISQGASEINISCAVQDLQSDKALLAVHQMLEE
ncbi:MAG: aspartate kinase [Proteobacteria bacterium]|nr:aspartate kinase [Pseudomonadota bacterium]